MSEKKVSGAGKWYWIEKKLLRWIVKNRDSWDIICGVRSGSLCELDEIIEQLDQEGFMELEYAMMCRRDVIFSGQEGAEPVNAKSTEEEM